MTKKASSTNLINRFAIVLDTSGSMSSIQKPTVAMFNEQVSIIREQAKKSGQETSVSLMLFGLTVEGKNNVCRMVYFNADVATLKPLTVTQYTPQGMTPMLDGVGLMAEKFTEMSDANDKNVSFVMLVLTDGLENASERFTARQIANTMRELQATDRWTFAFLLPDNQVTSFQQTFPMIPEGNIRPWEPTTNGVKEVSAMMGQAAGAYYTGRAQGKAATKNYFVTDASKISKTDLKHLTDLSGRVKIWTIANECPIKAFVEAKGERYAIGCAFYALTKAETVQPGKQVLIMEKGSKKVYGGAEARDLLGLVHTSDVQVKPGNHANYDIYVQSTSVNRKLVRGTKLVYFV